MKKLLRIFYRFKYPKKFTWIFASSTIFFGILGFYEKHHDFLTSILHALFKSVALFSFSFPSIKEFSLYTILASLSAILTVFYTIISLLIKSSFNQLKVTILTTKEYIGVFGLGEISRTFLDNTTIQDRVLIVEKDEKMAKEYRSKDYAVSITDVFSDELEEHNLKNMKTALIALGDDQLNIEFAKKLISKCTDDTKIIVHIENNELEVLFHTQFIMTKDQKVNIKTFSFYEEVAKNLFKHHFIDGDSLQYMHSNKTFSSVILGDGILLEKILYQIALISHLPNENMHTIYIIDKNANELLIRIKKALYYKLEDKSFPKLNIQAIQLDQNRLDFYDDNIWNDISLVNIIICFDEEKKNLNSAIELYNRVYLQKAVNDKKMPKIFFAIFDKKRLSKEINDNKDEFKNFFTFGSANEILNQQELIDDESDLLGKLVHYNYDGFLEGKEKHYNKNKLIHYSTDSKMRDDVNLHWYNNATYNDKLSSIAQAKMIDMKLKALGLKKRKTDTKIDILLQENRKIFDSKIDEDFDGTYSFPHEFDSTLFKKLIRMEHNRWNSFHYLNGWKYSINKDKAAKLHNCLLPLNEFQGEIRNTIIYDIYSFMYIPNYLAEAGYKIYEYKSVGITGHRELKNRDKIIQIVKKELTKLNQQGIKRVLSPLADGADRIVAKYAQEVLNSELIVPLPFPIQEYKKDFTKESNQEFDRLVDSATFIIELSDFEDKNNKKPLYNETRNNLYKKCGEFIVDKCDVLIAIWDGEKSNGVGGTAEIVQYAKEKKRYIIHINSENLTVDYINSEKVNI